MHRLDNLVANSGSTNDRVRLLNHAIRHRNHLTHSVHGDHTGANCVFRRFGLIGHLDMLRGILVNTLNDAPF